jgi:hypothetical protein
LFLNALHSGRVSSQKAHPMTDRFPPLRSQADLSRGARSGNRALSGPAPADVTLIAAMILVVALALI